MKHMNYEGDVEGKDPADVAHDFLVSKHLIWDGLMSSIIEFKGIGKHYQDSDFSIDNFNLSVENGDFVTMIGSSGCVW